MVPKLSGGKKNCSVLPLNITQLIDNDYNTKVAWYYALLPNANLGRWGNKNLKTFLTGETMYHTELPCRGALFQSTYIVSSCVCYLLWLSRLAKRRQVRDPISANALTIDPNHTFAHPVHLNGYWVVSFRSIKVCLQKVLMQNHFSEFQSYRPMFTCLFASALPWTM